jgi:alpha-glucosidase (family GH31 glycosyl hydrolase)
MNSIRNSVRLKYKLLLYFYTKFFEYSLTGIPICKPPWLRFPGNYKFYGDVESYSHMMIGDEFLVIPYLEKPKAIELDFKHSGFYDFTSGQILDEKLLNDLLINDYEEKKLTLLVVAGSVIPWTDDIG